MTNPSDRPESYSRDPRQSTGAPRVAVLGLGRAGAALALELAESDLPVAGLWNRTARSVDPRLASLPLHSGVSQPPRELLDDADVILLALPDALLEGFASSLPVRPGTAVLHLSGSLDSSCLEGLPAGVHRGCYHPLQAFRAETSGRFQPPPYCVAVEGDSHAVRAARVLAKATGHPCVEIPAGGKAAYHAAAVLASNCLVALQDTACRVLGHAGVQEEDRWKLLWPLVAGTLSNLEDGRFAEAITGPVSRGDIGTVQRNLQAIGQDAAASEIYRLLGLASLELAAHGRLDPARTEEIRAVLVGQGH